MVKVSELKAKLKAAGMSTAGAKPALEARLRLHEEVATKQLRTADGANPCEMTAAALRQAAAKEAGISPMLEPDEILAEFVKHLAAKAPAAGAGGSQASSSARAASAGGGGGAAAAAGGAAVDPGKVIAAVLSRAELDEHAAILNMAKGGGADITAASPVAAMRKAYLKLSLLIHPDRNPGNPDATKAFQGLARAFERLSQPELYAEEEEEQGGGKKGKKPKVQRIARSNVGCKRTRVRCPRCCVPWSESKIEGNPDYFYNFLMMGLRSFMCSTCLFEFGAVTALHTCPFCRRDFEYSPGDYHRKIVCGNPGCDREFGFYEFPASDRVVTELKRNVKEELEKRARVVEQKRRRAESSARRGVGGGGVDLEKAFTLGLTDSCPRCGEPMSSFPDEADQRQHLRECTDTAKHRAHAAAKAKAKAREEKAGRAASAQLDAQSHATWRLLGAKTEQMWMLTEGSLSKECADAGIDAAGKSKEEMIAALASVRGDSGQLRLEGGGGSGGGGGGAAGGSKPKRRPMTASSLPTNYHSMSLPELKAVLAAHGVVSDASSKAAVLAHIEHELHEGAGVQLRIAGPASASAPSKRVADSDTDSSDDEAVLVMVKKHRKNK